MYSALHVKRNRQASLQPATWEEYNHPVDKVQLELMNFLCEVVLLNKGVCMLQERFVLAWE